MLSLVLAALVLPTVWIVDANNGPGTNFTDLPAAVAAAQSGDTILVRAGTYTAFAVVGKALTIRGAGASTTIVDLPTGVPGYSHTTISGPPSGGTVFLSGFAVRATSLGISAAALNVTAGAKVAIADCTVTGYETTGNGRTGLQVVGSEVHATRCTFHGGYASPGFGLLGFPAVLIQGGARLAADACIFYGGNPAGGLGVTCGNALSVSAGNATLSRCHLVGGNSYNSAYVTGGHGIAATNASFVRLAGTSGNQCLPGSGTTPGSAVFADASSAVVVHGPVTLTISLFFPPSISGPVTLGAARLPYLSLTGTPLASGETNAALPVTVDLDGIHPNALYVLAVGEAPDYVPAAPFALGEILLSLPTALTSVGLLDATGHRTFAFVPIGLPSLLDHPIYSQAAVFDGAAGQFRLSQGAVRIFSL